MEGARREVRLLLGEKGLKDFDHMIDVYLVGKHGLKIFPEEACRLDAHERLDDALLSALRHPRDDG